MDISSILAPLQKFSDARLKSILSEFDLNNASADQVGQLRTKLVNLLSQEDKEKKGKKNELTDSIHAVLLKLAESYPLNEKDVITLGAIPSKYRVFASTGHQFNIKELLRLHKRRDVEKDGKKTLTNPISNLPFSELDTLHILNIAKEKQLDFEKLNIRNPLDKIKVRLENLRTTSEETGIRYEDLVSFNEAEEAFSSKLYMLTKYLKNSIEGREPALSLQDVPQLTVEQSFALGMLYNLIESHHLTLSEAKTLSSGAVKRLSATTRFIKADLLTLSEAKELRPGEINALCTITTYPENLSDQISKLRAYQNQRASENQPSSQLGFFGRIRTGLAHLFRPRRNSDDDQEPRP